MIDNKQTALEKLEWDLYSYADEFTTVKTTTNELSESEVGTKRLIEERCATSKLHNTVSKPTQFSDDDYSEWIKPTGMMPPEFHGHYECMKCGGWVMKDWHKPWSNGGVVLTKYCPYCGRKMENGYEFD